MRPAFVFAPDLCTGCEACRVACGNENGAGRDTGWRQVITFNPERHPALPTLHLSLACNHCEVPACANGCPARAYRRDATTGAVLIDTAKCIGCRYCSWVCPYDAPQFDERGGVMTKCTFCVPRLESGLAPACIAACPTGALALGERPSPSLEPAFHGLGAWGLGPALTLVASRRSTPPEGQACDDATEEPPAFPPRRRKITLGAEKGLVAFTLLMPALAAWFAGGVRVPERSPALAPFLGAAALAFALSMAHLGRPLRAWRATLGLSTSWLSREVAATGAFVALAALALALPAALWTLGLPALLAAALLVIAIDGAYRAVPRAAGPRFHGAESTTAFLLLSGIAADLPPVALLAGAVKLGLMAVRRARETLGMPAWVALLRVALLAAALAALLRPWPWGIPFGLALGSEALDRAAFYAGLEPSTPASRMEAEARAALHAAQRA
jgi:Fe-S-cluster-containing dehydrogenase component